MVKKEQDLLELKFRKIVEEIIGEVIWIAPKEKDGLNIKVRYKYKKPGYNDSYYNFTLEYTNLERSRELIVKEVLSDLKELESRSYWRWNEERERELQKAERARRRLREQEDADADY